MTSEELLDEFENVPVDEIIETITTAGLENQFSVNAEYHREENHVAVTISMEPVVSALDQYKDVIVRESQSAEFRVILNARENDVETVLEMITQLAKQEQYGVPHGRVVSEGLRCGWDREHIEDTIEELRRTGLIYSPKTDTYQPT